MQFHVLRCFCIPYSLLLGGIPARTADGRKVLLFMGIIDILQSYRLKKKLEHTLKAIYADGVRGGHSHTHTHMFIHSTNMYANVQSSSL